MTTQIKFLNMVGNLNNIYLNFNIKIILIIAFVLKLFKNRKLSIYGLAHKKILVSYGNGTAYHIII